MRWWTHDPHPLNQPNPPLPNHVPGGRGGGANEMKAAITFGALAPDIKDQLETQGIRLAGVEHVQADADAISRLAVRGLLSDAASTSARKRLMKFILKHATPIEKKKPIRNRK